jgi:hypothetical protein
VHDQVTWFATGSGFAGVVELEERRPGYQAVAVQPGQQRHAPLGRGQPGGAAGGDDGAGQVDQLAAVPPGPGSDNHDPAGPQQGCAAGQDAGDAVEQGVQAVVGEVDRDLVWTSALVTSSSARRTTMSVTWASSARGMGTW